MADLYYASREAAPEQIRSLLVENAGKFVFSAGDSAEVAGYVPKAKHDEFRENNIALTRERDALNAKVEQYKDIDPAKAREAMVKLRELEDKKLIDAGQIDKVVSDRVERIVAEKDSRINELSGAVEQKTQTEAALKAELSRILIHDQLKTRALSDKHGILPSAMNLITGLAEHGDDLGVRWILDDNRKPIAIKANGQPAYSPKDANKPLDQDEWLEGVAKQYPNIVPSSAGGGAVGNPTGGGRVTTNLSGLSAVERMKAARTGRAA